MSSYHKYSTDIEIKLKERKYLPSINRKYTNNPTPNAISRAPTSNNNTSPIRFCFLRPLDFRPFLLFRVESLAEVVYPAAPAPAPAPGDDP